ncbi:MAG: L,D-transpeptidase [Flavipsychrobacter sp.]|nr:L,D-transpeptidase [Flavipsychrobacter sp.]
MPKYRMNRLGGIWVIVLVLCSISLHSRAQVKGNEPPAPTNYRVLEEHKDAKGNTVRTVQYEQGRNKMIETLVIPPKAAINLHRPINPDTLNKDSVLIVVNKSKYNVEVYYRRKMIRYYKAVFGPKPLENKKMEGDRCTPEGWFTIKNKNPNSKYDKFLQLNYPNDSCMACFNRLKDGGNLPKAARIGGDIGIHGMWKGGDDMIENGVGWTDGCIALKNRDIEELYTFTGIGTRVFIRK